MWLLADRVKNLIEKNDPVCQESGMASGGLNVLIQNSCEICEFKSNTSGCFYPIIPIFLSHLAVNRVNVV